MARVFVVGSIGVDLVAFAPRLPAKGETVLGDFYDRFPGAKGANQAVAAALAGAKVAMIGAVGKDANGEFMRDILAQADVDIGGIELVDAATQVALIMVGGGDNQIVVVPGANLHIASARITALPFEAGDICVAQGETTIAVVRDAFVRAHAGDALNVFNPAPAAEAQRPLLPLADVLVVNETEAALFSGKPFDVSRPEASLTEAAQAMGLQSAQLLVVTLGADGVVARRGAEMQRVAGHRVAAIDSTGAGDCFVGTLAAALARGDRLGSALAEANGAAALSVGGKGALASFPDRARVAELLAAKSAATRAEP